LLSLAGFCVADEAPGYTLYIQGGESSITEDTDGMITIKIQGIVPYFHLEFEKEKQLLPIGDISRYSLPVNAAIVSYGSDGDTTSLVQISNLSLSDENRVLTIQMKLLEFYDGDVLKDYAKDSKNLDITENEPNFEIGIIIEGASVTPENALPCIECYLDCVKFGYNPCVTCKGCTCNCRPYSTCPGNCLADC